MNPEIVRLGSLYVNGQSFAVGGPYNSGVLSFGDSIAGKEIQWVKDGKTLIADRCVCDDISWVQLDQMGLAKGTPVFIDGRVYLCRCPKTEPAFSEWELLLDKYGEGNDLWHWNHMYFWGQDEEDATRTSDIARCAVRGYHAANHGCWFDKTCRVKNLGFRPVLEPMPVSLKISRSLVGQKVLLYGLGGGSMTGTLEKLDDYDLFLSCLPPLPVVRSWMCLSGGMVVVPRNAVVWIRKV